MKRIILLLVSISLIVLPLTALPVEAEPGYTDTSYWNERCTGKAQMSAEDKEACLGYSAYLQKQNDGLGEQLSNIEAKRQEIAKDIQYYANKINEYQVQIDAKQVEINSKQGEIDAKQVEIDSKQADIDAKQTEIDNKQVEIDNKQLEIDAKQVEIDAKQKEIDATQADIDTLNQKISDRLIVSQSTMRINKYLEILIGVSSFEDFMRIANALNNISQYDNKTMNDMIDLKALLKTQQEELVRVEEEMKKIQQEMIAVQDEMKVVQAEMVEEREVLEGIQSEMEIQKQALTSEQGEIIALQYETQVIEDEILRQEAELQAQYAAIAADIESKNAAMRDIASAGLLDAIVIQGTTAGWTNPVPAARRSAGTWFYPGGGLHLGYDFAAPVGSTIYSPGNGVVINSVNGCPTYGGLGNWCTGAGGAYGGGNQIYLLLVVNGSLYGVQMAHMMLGSPIAAGTIVSGGTPVGQVGSSGNSSGPHCHIEIFYLGDGSNFSSYAQNWNGDCAFGAGWGYDGYNRRCEAGNGAPCRIQPESVFGY